MDPSLYNDASKKSVFHLRGLLQEHAHKEKIESFISDCKSMATEGTLAVVNGNMEGQEALREFENRYWRLQNLGDHGSEIGASLHLFTDALHRTAQNCFDADRSFELQTARTALQSHVGGDRSFSSYVSEDVHSTCHCVDQVQGSAERFIDRSAAGTAPLHLILPFYHGGADIVPLDKVGTSVFLAASHYELQKSLATLSNCPKKHTFMGDGTGSKDVDIELIKTLSSILLDITQRHLKNSQSGVEKTEDAAGPPPEQSVAIDPADCKLLMKNYARHMGYGLEGVVHD